MMESHEDRENGHASHLHAYPLLAYYVQSPPSPEPRDSYSSNRPEPTLLVLTQDGGVLAAGEERLVVPRSSSLSGFSAAYSPERPPTTRLFDKEAKSCDLGLVGPLNRLILIGRDRDDYDEEDEDEDAGGRHGNLWRYLSFRRSDSWWWVTLQMTWRLLVSLGMALLVFYLATQPPPPAVSVKVVGDGGVVLGEGVDARGVSTKILTCNCSVDLFVDNKSKVFPLRIKPPKLQLSFDGFVLAASTGPKLYAESHGSTLLRLHVGTRGKAMYGAGRNMQDRLESRRGLTLTVGVSFSSEFRVVWNLINPRFHHRAECSLLLYYDRKLRQVTRAAADGHANSCRLIS